MPVTTRPPLYRYFHTKSKCELHLGHHHEGQDAGNHQRHAPVVVEGEEVTEAEHGQVLHRRVGKRGMARHFTLLSHFVATLAEGPEAQQSHLSHTSYLQQQLCSMRHHSHPHIGRWLH